MAEPTQLLGFEDYIVRNELVDARYATFYRMWVERFRRFANSGPDAATRARLAVPVPGRGRLDRPSQRDDPASSRIREDRAACHARRGERGRHPQARHSAHVAPLVRHTPAAERDGPPRDPGIARPREFGDDHGLSRDHVATWNGTHVARTWFGRCRRRPPARWTGSTAPGKTPLRRPAPRRKASESVAAVVLPRISEETATGRLRKDRETMARRQGENCLAILPNNLEDEDRTVSSRLTVA